MNYYVHSRKIKIFSIIIFIINIVNSLLLGSVFQNSYSEGIFQKYNFGLAISGIILSIVVFIIFNVFVVNMVEAIEDVTKAINEGIPIICSNKRRVAQVLKELIADTTDSNDTYLYSEHSVSKNSWKCSVCGRINQGYNNICRCGELKSFE